MVLTADKMGGTMYAISDLHLDHTNIIRYCNRPFSSTDQMNRVLVSNWNRTVRPTDTVIFVGDMAYGTGHRSADFWLEKLNGKIVFINGSHDRLRKHSSHPHAIIEYKGNRFYVVHDPNDIPNSWKGWTIHGHHHNNHMNEYPFINFRTKTVNVSCELINYTPIPVGAIVDEIARGNGRNIGTYGGR